MDGSQVSANIQGAEYEFAHFESIFSRTYNGGRSLHDHDAPCVVCLAPSRSAQLMVPAKRTCPSGWTLEYRGYLVTDHPNHNVKDFVCLDEEPEALPGSQANQNGALFYTVEAICGSLPCPPYVNGWELTCAVCTKWSLIGDQFRIFICDELERHLFNIQEYCKHYTIKLIIIQIIYHFEVNIGRLSCCSQWP